MKALLLLATLLSPGAWAQDPQAYFSAFEAKVYSLRTKGVKDFVVDVESSKLTKQLNDQGIFGRVKAVTFRTYWTAAPERISIEVLGLPEGFKEVKEDLKVSVLSLLDNLLPVPMAQRFPGYRFQAGTAPKEFLAQDTTGIASVPAYVLKFDAQDKLESVTGKKAVGSLVATPKYEKDGFADGRWVLKNLTTVTSENGQTVTVKKTLNYGTSQGMGVLTRVSVNTEQKSDAPGSKALNSEETLEFKNYKINNGDALKHFLGEAKPTN